MNSSYTTLVHSKFFNPAFNSAIYDGPVRIYFAQFHEALALKVYFLIQQKLTQELAQAKAYSKVTGANVLIMIYPTLECFHESFAGPTPVHGTPLVCEHWNDDVVIGTCGSLEESQLESLVENLRAQILSWKLENKEGPRAPETLL